MGATRDDFVKYPRTPHLFGSKGTDDDKHLGRKESEAFIADPSLIVEEKIDGTNVGIHFTVDYAARIEIVYLEPPISTISRAGTKRRTNPSSSPRTSSALGRETEPPTAGNRVPHLADL